MIKPNFFIVGAPKCGTSALYKYLRRHPQVFMPDKKEPNYFGRRTRTRTQCTEEQYLALFQAAEGYPFVGEASPLNLVCETAAREIHAFSPDAKIIAMVRDPVAMMYSLHAQCLLNCDEDHEDFEAALEAEPDRLQGNRIPSICGDTARLFYRRCARFTEQLERYIDIFGRDRVHVIVFDDIKADAATVYAEVLRFLGAEPFQLPEYLPANQCKRLKSPKLGRLSKRIQTAPLVRYLANTLLPTPYRRKISAIYLSIERRVNRAPHKRPPLAPELERTLRMEFTPEILRLGQMLGRDLSHWTVPGFLSEQSLQEENVNL